MAGVVFATVLSILGYLGIIEAAAAPPPTAQHPEFVAAFGGMPANSHWFWSGRRLIPGDPDGACESGQVHAKELADAAGGFTLESMIAANGLTMPANNDRSVQAAQIWDDASFTFASTATGTVHFVRGEMRPCGTVWETIELPALTANNNVQEIIQVDSITHEETVIFDRGGLAGAGATADPGDGGLAGAGATADLGDGSCTLSLEESDGGDIIVVNAQVDFNQESTVTEESPAIPETTFDTINAAELNCTVDKPDTTPDYGVNATTSCTLDDGRIVATATQNVSAAEWIDARTLTIALRAAEEALAFYDSGSCSFTLTRQS